MNKKGIEHKKKKRLIIASIIAVLVIFCIGTYAVLAENVKVRHYSDTFLMANEGNSNQTLVRKDETTGWVFSPISSAIRQNYVLGGSDVRMMCTYYRDEDHTVNGNPIEGANVYGPYIWLPKGDYEVTIKFTNAGFGNFLAWDIGTDRGSLRSEFVWKSTTGSIKLSDDLGLARNIRYSDGGRTLTYTFTANGNRADYEWRLFFSCSYEDASNPADLVESVGVSRVNSNNVTYDTDGGTLNGSTAGRLTTTNWGSQRTSSVPVPTREGYTFTGWYAQEKGENNNADGTDVEFTGDYTAKIWDENGNLCSSALTETSYVNYKVRAGWEQKTSNLVFHANNGSIDNSTNNVTKTVYYGRGNWCDVSGFNMSRTGYEFVGWNTSTNADGTEGLGDWVYGNGTDTTQSGKCNNAGVYWKDSNWCSNNGQVDVYAVWKPKTYTITFHPEGGKVNGSSGVFTLEVTYGTPNWSVVTPAEKDNSKFTGWYTASSNGTKVYTNEGNCVKNNGVCWDSNGCWNRLSNLDVYAQYSSDYYYVEYNLNGGNGTLPSKTRYNAGSNVKLADINDASLSGYKPTTYNLNRNGTSTSYASNSTISVNELAKAVGANSGDTITLYVIWKSDSSKLVVNGSGTGGWIGTDYTFSVTAFSSGYGIRTIQLKEGSTILVTKSSDNGSTTSTFGIGVDNASIDFGAVFDETYYAKANSDVVNAFGNSKSALFNHFLNYGMAEGRQGSSQFNLTSYIQNNADVYNAYKNDANYYKRVYEHYVLWGRNELNRISSDMSIINYTYTKEGTHTLTIYAKELDGSTDSQNFEVKIDKSAPDIVVKDVNTGTSKTNSNGLSVNYTDSGKVNLSISDKYSGVASYSLKDAKGNTISIDSNGNATITETGTYTIVATDKVGNSRTISFTATVNKEHNYTVEHWFENSDGTYTQNNRYKINTSGSIVEDKTTTTNSSAKTGTTVTAARASVDSTLYNLPDVQTIKISTTDSNNKVVYKYSRKTYTLTLEKDENISSVSKNPNATNYKWGTSVKVSAELNSDTNEYSYSWVGWTGTYSSNTQKNYSVTMPNYNVTLKANGSSTLKEAKVICIDKVKGTDTILGTQTAKTYTIGTSINAGDIWGKDTTLSAYYTNYVYVGCSDTATVTADGITVYRYFELKTQHILKVRYENADYTNADNQYTDWTEVVNGWYSKNDTVAWSRAEDDVYEAASVSYKVTSAEEVKITEINIKRKTKKVVINKDDTINTVSGAGTYRVGQTVNISAEVKSNTSQYTYSWGTWSSSVLVSYINNTSAASQNASFVMPTSDVTMTANGSKVVNKYKVEVNHYVMKTYGSYDSTPDVTDTLTEQEYGKIENHSSLIKQSLLVEGGIEYDSAKSNESTTVTGDIVINLYYKRVQHKVILNVAENGGSWSGGITRNNEFKLYYGANIPLTDFSGMKSRFGFVGWNMDMNAIEGQSGMKMGNTDMTFYAIYSREIVTTFIDADKSTDVKTTIYNKATSGTIDAPGIAAYTGWEKASNPKIVGYNSHKDITASAGGDKDSMIKAEISDGQKSVTVTDDKTYYAVYSADVKLSYVLNGGDANDTTADVTKTVYVNAHDLKTIKGFELNLAECKKPRYDESGYIHTFQFAVWAENSEDGARYNCNAGYILKSDTIMYALWDETIEPVTYYIEFDGNAGTSVSNVPDTITTQYDITVTLPTQEPERTGFNFVGWNLRSDGDGTMYQPGDAVKNLTTIDLSTVKLYAQWERKKFQIVKNASDRYSAEFVRRSENDEEWYDSLGKLTINETISYPDEKCAQIWNIGNDGIIERIQ